MSVPGEAMTGERVVRYQVDRGVAVLTLDDPGVRNAWSRTMEEQYFALLDRASCDGEVRAIVVTGAGNSFCPGLDASRLQTVAGGAGLQLSGRRPMHHALTVPKPMIAAINGACAGVGLIQALVCDVRFVARQARLSTAFARRGLAAEYGLSWLLPRLVGLERALDLLLSARTFDGEEAHRIGLASRLAEADTVVAEATAYARELAERCSPWAMAAIRRQVWGDLGRDYTAANEVWLATMRRFNRDNPDFVEGVASFREKRQPAFAPLNAEADLPPLPPFAAQD